MRAGAMMYGLHRRSTLEQVGDVPPVLLSDVLFLSHLSLYGTFLQVPEVLWYRGARRTGGSMRRQRASLFGERPPRMTFLPVSLQHTLWLLRRMASGTTRPPGTGLALGMRITLFYLTNWWVRLLHRAVAKNRKRLAKMRKRLAKKRRR